MATAWRGQPWIEYPLAPGDPGHEGWGYVDAVGPEVTRVAERMADAGPDRVRVVDPAALPGGLDAAARIAGVSPEDLASNGGVVVEVGDKRRVVDRLQLVSIGQDEQGGAAVESVNATAEVGC